MNFVCVRLSEEGGEEEELVDHAYEAFYINRSSCSEIWRQLLSLH